MKRIVDLHTHSIHSIDGELKPEVIIDKAINEGIKYYALSDHDGVEGIEIALDYAKDKDIVVIPAIEISSYMDEYPLHILGYNIDYHNQIFIEHKKRFDELLVSTDEKIVKAAKDFGFIFEEENLHKRREDGLFCEGDIGDEILADKRNDNNPLLKDFREGGRLSDNPGFNFFKEFCAPGKPCHVDYDFNIHISEAEKMIHSSGGKMFLAHPGHNIKKDEEVLKKIISYGLDGIEVFSSYHNDDMTDYYYEMAKKYNLYMSVGSDFHGKSKPAIRLASIDYDEEEINKTLIFLGVNNG